MSSQITVFSPSIYISDIHCLRTSTTERFSAFLRLPSGLTATPVLEDVRRELLAPDSQECLVSPVNLNAGNGLFALDLNRLSECGVRQCTVENEDDWLCVMVR